MEILGAGGESTLYVGGTWLIGNKRENCDRQNVTSQRSTSEFPEPMNVT